MAGRRSGNSEENEETRRATVPVRTQGAADLPGQARAFFASERGEELGAFIDGILAGMYNDTRGDGAILRQRYGEPTVDAEGTTVAPESARTAIREDVYRLLTSTSQPDAILRYTSGIVVYGTGDSLRVYLDMIHAREVLPNFIRQSMMRQEQTVPQGETADAFFTSERGERLGNYIDGMLSRMYEDTRGDGALLRRVYGEPTTDSGGRLVAPESARTAVRNEVYRVLTSTLRPDVAVRDLAGISVYGSGNLMRVEFDLRHARDPLSNLIHQVAFRQGQAEQQQETPATRRTTTTR